MIPSSNSGWQTTIADLALILFMVSAAALAQSDDAAAVAPPPPAAAVLNPLPAVAEPVAIYRAGAGMPSLNDWLANQAPDSRQQLTIIARYSSIEADAAADAALGLADAARRAGWQPRIMLEPGETDSVLAVLGYDDAGADTSANAGDMAR